MMRNTKKILGWMIVISLFLTLNIAIIQFTTAAGDIQFSTYFGGSSNESQEDTNDLGKMSVDVDEDDNLILVGRTYSSNYPETSPIPGVIRGDSDASVSKFTSDGSVLLFSTIIGGGSKDWATDVDTDTEGNIYVVGTTTSSNFYLNESEQLNNHGGFRNNDAWVAKITTAGVVEWSRYFGGSGDDWGYSIGVDSNQNVFITGSTYSGDLASLKSGDSYKGGVDCYLAKFNSSGHIQFSTLIGGISNDAGVDLEIDSEDNIVIAAGTWGADFPTFNAQYSVIEGVDGVILKYDNSGELLFSTIVGGSGQDRLWGIALDESDDIYFVGRSHENSWEDSRLISNDYSDYESAFYLDVFAGKLRHDGQKLHYLTVFGGEHNDIGMGIEVDSDNNAYIVGESDSEDFPSREPFGVYSDDRESFLTILNPKGRILTSSIFGGSDDEVCRDIKFTSSGNIILVGFTDSYDFPIENAHPGNSSLNGGTDLFIMSLSMTLPSLPQYPLSFILWTSISGGIGSFAIIGLVLFLVVRKKRKATA